MNIPATNYRLFPAYTIIYTDLTNLSMKQLVKCRVYTDVGGIT